MTLDDEIKLMMIKLMIEDGLDDLVYSELCDDLFDLRDKVYEYEYDPDVMTDDEYYQLCKEYEAKYRELLDFPEDIDFSFRLP